MAKSVVAKKPTGLKISKAALNGYQRVAQAAEANGIEPGKLVEALRSLSTSEPKKAAKKAVKKKVTKVSRTPRRAKHGQAPETCRVEGCNRPHRARGYCDSHYQRSTKDSRFPVVCPQGFKDPGYKRNYSPPAVEATLMKQD